MAIFTARKNEEIVETEKIDAQINGIALVTQEKIQELVNMARYLKKIADISNVIRSCIPLNTKPAS